MAICKSRTGEPGNGMRGMMGMRGIRVGWWECGDQGGNAGNQVENVGNAGNQGGNDGNAGNQRGNDGNKGENLRKGVELTNYNCGEGQK